MKCSRCYNEAINTTVFFYHDYGSAMNWEPRCDDHTPQDYRGNSDSRGHKTAYGIVLSEQDYKQTFASDVGLSCWHCDVCEEYRFEIERSEATIKAERKHDCFLCNSCAINPHLGSIRQALRDFWDDKIDANQIAAIFTEAKVARGFYVSDGNHKYHYVYSIE